MTDSGMRRLPNTNTASAAAAVTTAGRRTVFSLAKSKPADVTPPPPHVGTTSSRDSGEASHKHLSMPTRRNDDGTAQGNLFGVCVSGVQEPLYCPAASSPHVHLLAVEGADTDTQRTFDPSAPSVCTATPFTQGPTPHPCGTGLSASLQRSEGVVGTTSSYVVPPQASACTLGRSLTAVGSEMCYHGDADSVLMQLCDDAQLRTPLSGRSSANIPDKPVSPVDGMKGRRFAGSAGLAHALGDVDTNMSVQGQSKSYARIRKPPYRRTVAPEPEETNTVSRVGPRERTVDSRGASSCGTYYGREVHSVDE